jgi:hypothetical protein
MENVDLKKIHNVSVNLKEYCRRKHAYSEDFERTLSIPGSTLHRFYRLLESGQTPPLTPHRQNILNIPNEV